MIILQALTVFIGVSLAILSVFRGRVRSEEMDRPLSSVYYSLAVVSVAGPILWVIDPVFTATLLIIAAVGFILARRSE